MQAGMVEGRGIELCEIFHYTLQGCHALPAQEVCDMLVSFLVMTRQLNDLQALWYVSHLLGAGDTETNADWLLRLPLEHFDESLHPGLRRHTRACHTCLPREFWLRLGSYTLVLKAKSLLNLAPSSLHCPLARFRDLFLYSHSYSLPLFSSSAVPQSLR